jgi:hypothetical protein
MGFAEVMQCWMAALIQQSPRTKNPSSTPSHKSDLMICENMVLSKTMGWDRQLHMLHSVVAGLAVIVGPEMRAPEGFALSNYRRVLLP